MTEQASKLFPVTKILNPFACVLVGNNLLFPKPAETCDGTKVSLSEPSSLPSAIETGSNILTKKILLPSSHSKIAKVAIPRIKPFLMNKAKDEKRIETANGRNPGGFSCGICGKLFNFSHSVSKHMLIHTGEKPYSCRICGKSFTQDGNMREHELTHTEQKRPHVCPICGKTFRQSRHLDGHMRAHTGTRPYTCDVCDKTFKYRSHFTEHKRVHTGETLSCDFCGLNFTRKYEMQVHRRTHTGEKPYTCIICSRGFSQSSALKSHMCLHTGKKLHKCVCGKEYTRKGHLQKHMESAHKNKETGQLDCPSCSESFEFTIELIEHQKEAHNDIINIEETNSKDLDFNDANLIALDITKLMREELSYNQNKNYVIPDALNIKQEKMVSFPTSEDKTEITQSSIIPEEAVFLDTVKDQTEKSCQESSQMTCVKEKHSQIGSPHTKILENKSGINLPNTQSLMEDDSLVSDYNSDVTEPLSGDEICVDVDDKVDELSMMNRKVDDGLTNKEDGIDILNKTEVKFPLEEVSVEMDHSLDVSEASSKTGENEKLDNILKQLNREWEFVNYTEEDIADGRLFESDPEEEYEELANAGPHVCRICGMRFVNWTFMQEHLYAHVDKLERYISKIKSKVGEDIVIENDADKEENRFICGLCGMGFPSQGRLNKHLRKHTGEKTVKCNICEKRLVDQNALHRHLRIHTGEKPYQCEFCQKTFSQRSNLNSHKRVHHTGLLGSIKTE